MNKYSITVPKEIKYISDWQDFLTNITQLPCILDKKVTGCGFTEWALTNNLNIIICSPRKILLENKESQHEGEVFYFRNELEKELKYDKDLKISSLESKKEIEQLLKAADEESDIPIEEVIASKEVRNLINRLMDYCNLQTINAKSSKILVTYDSFKYVKSVLSSAGILDNFLIIVDEFQSIFTDSRFKATTELDFIIALHDLPNVIYASATPMIEEYLEQLDEFKDLPYYELDWVRESPLRLQAPVLKVTKLYSQSIQSVIGELVRKYRAGDTESTVITTSSGESIEVKSKEAVFFVNSVKNICSAIKRFQIRPEECNILCANTPVNVEDVRKAFGLKKKDVLEIGRVPRYGEPHKMFTFCTRTVYLGADFYSTNAKTFVFSDADIESMAVDITLDLPQIMGRQRLYCNPWKNRADLYFKIPREKDFRITDENFKNLIDRKTLSSNRLISAYDTSSTNDVKAELSRVYERESKAYNYTYNYIAVNGIRSDLPIPVLNKLVMLAEVRAFHIQTIDYKDRFSLFNAIEAVNSQIQGNTNATKQFLDKFDKLVYFPEKLELLVNTVFDTEEEYSHILNQIPLEYSKIIKMLSVEEMKSVSFRREPCLIKADIKLSKDVVGAKMLELFSVGNTYTKSYIKNTLQSLYDQLGLKKLAKAVDLEVKFKLKDCKITVDGKREHSFKLVEKD